MIDSGNQNPSLGEVASLFLAKLSSGERKVSQPEVYKFVRWYGWERPLAALTAPEVANYAERLSLSDTDYSKKLELIRAFLAYVKKVGWSKTNLAIHLKAKKVKAGVDFIQTQAVYDVPKFAKYMEMVCEQGLDKQVHILAGVIPIRSVGMARYMKDYVSGVSVPDEIITRLEQAEKAKEEGVQIILEIIEQLKEIPGVHGIHIMAVGWEDIVPEMVAQAGLMPRPLL